jgi:hypothetical protein
MKTKITVEINLVDALQQLKSKNGRAYGYFLARSKRGGRTPRYMRVVDKIFLR